MTLPIEVQVNIVNIAIIVIWQVDIIQVSMYELGHHTSPATGLQAQLYYPLIVATFLHPLILLTSITTSPEMFVSDKLGLELLSQSEIIIYAIYRNVK